MFSHEPFKAITISVLACCSLAACGGGDSSHPASSSGDRPPSTTSASFKIGGTATGLDGTLSVRLANGSDTLVVSTSGEFSFVKSQLPSTNYDVTILFQPDGLSCTVTNGSGTVVAADVTNILVKCVPAPILNLAFGIKQLKFSWNAIAGASYYRLEEDLLSNSEFSPITANILDTQYTYEIPLYRHAGASYRVSACDNSGCTSSRVISPFGNKTCDETGCYALVSTPSQLVNAVGYFKPSSTIMGMRFGSSVSLSQDGTTLAIGAPGESSAATGINGNPNTGGNQFTVCNPDTSTNCAPSSGAVYIYKRDSSGNWSQTAYIKPSNTSAGAEFGRAVALNSDGSTLAVGAPHESTVFIDEGAAYVFVRDPSGGWSQQAYLQGTTTHYFAKFGGAISLSGDGSTLVVGAAGDASNATGINGNEFNDCLTAIDPPGATNCSQGAGAVYVFTRSSATWTRQAYIKASNTLATSGIASSALFGSSLALSRDGNTLAVGAEGESSGAVGVNGNQAIDCASLGNCALGSGAVYLFTRSGNSWNQQAYLKASNTSLYMQYGSSVALSANGDTLAVGAANESTTSPGINGDQTAHDPSVLGDGSGAVYLLVRDGSGLWSQQAFIKASKLASDEYFGSATSLSDDGSSLAVGANGFISLNDVDGGVAYFFSRNSSDTWTQQAYVRASNARLNHLDYFGGALSLSGDGNTLVVGGIGDDSNATGVNGDQVDVSAPGSGAVYLY